MRNSKLFLASILSITTFSCSLDPKIDPKVAISEEEAVAIIEGFLAGESAGMEETISEYARTYQEEFSLDVQCNQEIAESYNFSNDGSVVQADYKYNWTFTVSCNGLNVPQSAVFNSIGNGTYSSPRIESEDSSAFAATVTGLQPSSSSVIFSGTYQRKGTQQLRTDQKVRNLSTEFNANIENVKVEKAGYHLDSGSGMFILKGSSDQGNFSISGSIVFNGGKSATVTINGNEYTIDLNL